MSRKYSVLCVLQLHCVRQIVRRCGVEKHCGAINWSMDGVTRRGCTPSDSAAESCLWQRQTQTWCSLCLLHTTNIHSESEQVISSTGQSWQDKVAGVDSLTSSSAIRRESAHLTWLYCTVQKAFQYETCMDHECDSTQWRHPSNEYKTPSYKPWKLRRFRQLATCL